MAAAALAATILTLRLVMARPEAILHLILKSHLAAAADCVVIDQTIPQQEFLAAQAAAVVVQMSMLYHMPEGLELQARVIMQVQVVMLMRQTISRVVEAAALVLWAMPVV